MPHSLKVRLKNLQRKGELTEKDINRIFKALSQESCDDAINRQAVLEMAYDMSEIDGEHFTEPHMVVDVEDIQKLPPITQKSRKCLNKDDFIYALKTCGFSVYNGQVMYAEDDLIRRFDEIIESEETDDE